MADVLFNRLCQHQQCVFLELLGTLYYVSIVLRVYYTHKCITYEYTVVLDVFIRT